MNWNDKNCTLYEIKNRLELFNQERDWQKYHSPRNLAMALNVEAGELLELFLWCRDEGPQPARGCRCSDLFVEFLLPIQHRFGGSSGAENRKKRPKISC